MIATRKLGKCNSIDVVSWDSAEREKMNAIKNRWLWCSGVVLSMALSSNAYALTACNPFEKQVSVDGGTTWHNADDQA